MKFLLVFLALSVCLSSFAGGRAGNGFAVYCDREPSLGLAQGGYYSLDYLSTLGHGPSRSVGSWNESAKRIDGLLEKVLSAPLLESYRDFVSNVLNTNYTKKRVWEQAPFGVINLKKAQSLFGGPGLHPEQTKSNLQSLVSLLPPTCMKQGEVEFVPAVVFQDHAITGRPKGYVVYKYVPKVTRDLETSDPLQLSYLYIHEWLWDISGNEDRNRRLNHFLHSEKIEHLSADAIYQQLTGMGLALTRPSSVSPVPLVTGDFASAPAEHAFEMTEFPSDRLLTKDEVWLHKQGTSPSTPAFHWGDYELFGIERDCGGGSCAPWKVSDLVWSKKLDPNVVHPEFDVPRDPGNVWLRWDGNLHVLVRTPDVSRGPDASMVILGCLLRDTTQPPVTCDEYWMFGGTVLFGHLKPRGTFPAPKFEGGFYLDTGFWIGWHGRFGDTEMRMAFRSKPIKAVKHHRVRPKVD